MTFATDPADALTVVSEIVVTRTSRAARLERDRDETIWLICDCRLQVPVAHYAHGLALLDAHRDACGRPVQDTPIDLARLEGEITATRIELTRVDSKASTLLALASTGLTAGLAVIGSGRLTNPATALAWLAVACVALGVLFLGLVVLPRLGGGGGGGRHGFMRWAGAESVADLGVLLYLDVDNERLRHLHALARITRVKYVRIRAALACLAGGIVAAIVAAALHSV